MAESRELTAYLNGWLVPHSQAVAKIGEGGSRLAGGFYDAERTFGGQVFKLREHLERLYQCVEFANLDPGMSIEKMAEATFEVLEANRPRLGSDDDYILSQVVCAGSTSAPDTNVVVYCQPIDFSSFAWGYLKGVRVITPVTYAVPARRSGVGADGLGQETYSLLTDEEGNVTECRHANFLFVSQGRIKLPNRQKVLSGIRPGISMETVLELAESLGVPVDEGDYCSADVYVADEAFISGTRYCLLPVSTFNGLTLGDGVPGVVTRKLFAAWSERVGMDFVKQALSHLPTEDTRVIVTGA